MTNGIVSLDNGRLCFTLDLRFGKDAKMDNMLKVLSSSLDSCGFDMEIINADDAYAVDTDNVYLQKYLKAYREYTGDESSDMRINAGSTYARCIGNACETGMRYKGTYLDLPSGHGYAHQPDENIGIDGLLNAIEIIIYAMIKINE
jgi:succinyl-diaminopimelate desuccinylase